MRTKDQFKLFPWLAISFFILTLCIAPCFASGQKRADKILSTAGAQTYEVGGKSISLPPPPGKMAEVGPEIRKVIESNSPGQRLLAAFVPVDVLPLSQPQWGNRLRTLFTVGVLHVAEFQDVSPHDFQEFAAYIPQNFHQIQKDWVTAHEDLYKVHNGIKGEPDPEASFHKPRSLGVFYSKQDGFAYGMLKWFRERGVTTQEVEVTLLVRVRSRLLMVSLKSAYENKKSVKWMRKTTQEWADAILNANRQDVGDPH